MTTQSTTGTCPWCSESIPSEQGVAIGPPPSLSSEHHRWTLHEECVQEWQSFADRLTQLSSAGAHETLVEYPRQFGTAELVDS